MIHRCDVGKLCNEDSCDCVSPGYADFDHFEATTGVAMMENMAGTRNDGPIRPGATSTVSVA